MLFVEWLRLNLTDGTGTEKDTSTGCVIGAGRYKRGQPVEEGAVVADNLRPVLRKLVLFLVVPQTVFPWGGIFAERTLVLL